MIPRWSRSVKPTINFACLNIVEKPGVLALAKPMEMPDKIARTSCLSRLGRYEMTKLGSNLKCRKQKVDDQPQLPAATVE
jgi:hypothetical protein